MSIIAPIPRNERHLMQKIIHKTPDKNHARRFMAMLTLYRGARDSDVASIHLNPKIGADWQLRGHQKLVVTLGQNEKYYLAGALHRCTEKSVTRVATEKIYIYLSVF